MLVALLGSVMMVSTAQATDDAPASAGHHSGEDCAAVLSIPVRPLMGSEENALCDEFAGSVLLVVNTASNCGFTPQFTGLNDLHERYADQGFAVLGFPSDGFNQELDTEQEVAEFCELNYGVDFPMFQKVSVRGEDVHPVFQALAASGAGEPTWNFNKYLISRDGEVLARFGSTTRPLGAELTAAIENEL